MQPRHTQSGGATRTIAIDAQVTTVADAGQGYNALTSTFPGREGGT